MISTRIAAIILGFLLLGIAAGFYQYETTTVPAWGLKVVDEFERPYPNMQVTQVWKNYTLETEPGQNFDTRVTDSDGYVGFPERVIKMSVLGRAARTMYSHAMRLVHGSVGIQAYVHASGPQGYEEVMYVSGEPLPNTLILKRQK